MTVDDLLPQLEAVRRISRGYIGRCPAHADKSPSLSIREDNARILIHCFSGCKAEEIVAALGLEMRDLFTDTPISHGQRPTRTPQTLGLTAVAYQFELAALNRRLRADAVLHAVAAFTSDDLSDSQRDRLMNAVARAFSDRDRAEFLEAVADDFRLKAFHERTAHHVAA